MGLPGIRYDLCEAVLAARRGTMDLGGRMGRGCPRNGFRPMKYYRVVWLASPPSLKVLPGGISFQPQEMTSHNLRARSHSRLPHSAATPDFSSTRFAVASWNSQLKN